MQKISNTSLFFRSPSKSGLVSCQTKIEHFYCDTKVIPKNIFAFVFTVLCQYFVEPPLAAMTAILLALCVHISFVHLDPDISAHWSWKKCPRPIRLNGDFWTAIFKSGHRLSIGLRSGLWLGLSNTQVLGFDPLHCCFGSTFWLIVLLDNITFASLKKFQGDEQWSVPSNAELRPKHKTFSPNTLFYIFSGSPTLCFMCRPPHNGFLFVTVP